MNEINQVNNVTNLNDLFFVELARISGMENLLTEALPQMAEMSSNDSLRSAFQTHAETTEAQLGRLQKITEMLNREPLEMSVESFDEMIEETQIICEQVQEGEIRDHFLIMAARKIEHLEMGCYLGLIALGKKCGVDDQVISILTEICEEEKMTDQKLEEATNMV